MAPPTLPDVVKHIVAQVHALQITERDGTFVWRATRVRTASTGDVRAMRSVLRMRGASQECMNEFDAWADADPTMHGERLVIFAEDVSGASISKASAMPLGIPVDVGTLTDDQFHAWWRTNQMCDLLCDTVKVVLETLLLNGVPLLVNAQDGDYRLTSIDRVASSTRIAINGLIWWGASVTTPPTRLRTLTPPESLTEAKAANHVILKLHLEHPNGSRLHIWCDPTARQVFPQLPFGIDVQLFRDCSLRKTGRYHKLTELPIVEYLDTIPDREDPFTTVPCGVARVVKHFDSMHFESRTKAEAELAKWQTLIDGLAPTPIDWTNALEDYQQYKAAKTGGGVVRYAFE